MGKFRQWHTALAIGAALLTVTFAHPAYALEVEADASDQEVAAVAVQEPAAFEDDLAASLPMPGADETTPSVEALPAQDPVDAPLEVGEKTEDGAPLDDEAPESEAPILAVDSSLVLDELTGETPTPAEGELDPTSYDSSTLLADDGVYSLSTKAGTDLVVSNSSGNAKLDKTTNNLQGYWKVSNLGEGRYQFASLAGKGTLHADGSSSGSNVSIGASGVWLALKCADGALALVPENNLTLRLDIFQGKLAAGSNVIVAAASGAASQRFFFTASSALTEAVTLGVTVDGGVYGISSAKAPAKMLDVKGGSTADKANVQVYSSNATMAQRVRLHEQGNGLYSLEIVKSHKYLDVAGGSTKRGANVQQYKGNSTLAQFWYLKKSGNGYAICNAKSGLALDLKNGKTANGTNVQVYTQNGTAAQTFMLIKDKAISESVAAGRVLPDGVYTLGASVGSNLVLDVSGAKLANGTNVQVYTSNSSMAQKYELTYQDNGLYTIQIASSGSYLDVSGGKSVKGTNVQQWKGNGSRAQMWYLVKSGSGYEVRSAISGLALDVAGGKGAKGTNVQVYTANGTAAQRFSLKQVALLSDGTYVFSSALSAPQLLEVKGASKGNTANVQISRMNRSKGQQWKLTYLGSGAYRITNANSGLALDVAGGSTANKANVRQYTSNGTDAQKWVLGISETGAITFKNVKSGKYLDVNGGKSASGTNVQQYSGNDSKAQGFVPYTSSSNFVTKGKTGYQNPSQYYQLSAYNCVLPSYANGFYTYVSSSRISPTATRSQCVEAFIQRAYDYLGTSYAWDWSMAPGQGVDCSGLVMQCLYAVGMQTPYNTYDHMYDPWQDHNAENMRADKKFKQISFSERQRGDLIFYPGHVGIYLGNDQIINAYPPQVQIQSVYSWRVTGTSRVFV